jgi:methyl-accepting chemotaxis protein
MDKVRPDDRYLKSAGDMVELSLGNPAAAQAKLADFMDSFHVLEKSMAALSDLIEHNSEATKEAGTAR